MAVQTFRNPIKRHGADPWLTYYNSWYYFSATEGTSIRMRRAQRIAALKDAPDEIVWSDRTPGRDREMWAQEFFLLDPNDGGGPRWYLYYTASDGVADANHRLFVCESAGLDPRGLYSFKAQLLTDAGNAYYAIDGSVLKQPDGALYLFWCGRPSPAGQGLYVSRLQNPWTLSGERVYLPADGFGCGEVREGPVTLQREGRVFLIYSACDTGKPDYKLAMLVAGPGADLLDPNAWTQHPAPVFTRQDDRGIYGPGHCFFFQSPDGTEDWIVYHAKTTSEYTYKQRSARAQRFTWNADGFPDFDTPLSLDTDIPLPSGEPAD